MVKIYFLHGLESSGNGTKGQFFKQNFPQVQRPDFTGELTQRLQQLEELCSDQNQLHLIGSSFGGLMATCFAIKYPQRVRRLTLLAPALNFPEFNPPPQKIIAPTLLLIGKKDDVTPASKVVPLAEATFATLEVRLEDDDHMLRKSFNKLPWQQLL